ncbi:MAG TPA: TonB-dependent receptor [Gemmatimonadaceae bacterium]|nr:TonB-dependent receptor [Gemmatimonadaceae bacterium]
MNRNIVRVLLAAVATPALLAAQQRDTVRTAQRTDTARIAPVVTTATRTPIPARDVPASVTVVSGAQLRTLGITSVADALAGTPSAMITQSGSFGGQTSLFLRGGESKYVKVLIDGVPVNDPGGSFDFGALSTDNVDHIEVLRGPASVLYGADAVTGVVSIVTRRGRTPPSITAELRGGTYHTGDASVALRGGVPVNGSGSADYSLSASRHETDGVYAFNNRFTETVVSGRADFSPSERDSLGISARYADSRYHYPTNSGGTIVDSNAFNAGDRIVLGASYTHAFSQVSSLQVNLASNGTTGGTTDRPDTTGGSLYLSLDDVRRYSAEARLNLRDPRGRGMVTLGVSADAADQNSQSQSLASGFTFNSTFDAYRRNRAAYAQLLWTGVPGVTAVVGARVDDNEAFGTFGTYRAAVNYLAGTGTRLRASVGTAFRAPTFFENFSTGFVTGNPTLHPAHTLSWEAGAEQSLAGGRATAGVTAFFQTFRDMIDYAGGTTACGYSYCNVARAGASGVEYSLSASPTSYLSATASFTHLQTRVLTAGFDTTGNGLYHLGEQLIRRPTTSWNALVRAGTAVRGTVDLRLMYVGRRADRDYRAYPAVPVTMPGYLRVDLSAVYPLRSLSGFEAATLTLRVQNLTGTTYQSVFNFLAPGRMILGGVRVRM